MKRSSIIGLCLMAVFAFSAVSVATAAAEKPEFVLKAGKTFPVNFNSTGGLSVLTTIHNHTVECQKLTNTGEIQDAHLALIKILFEECTTVISGNTLKCTTTGAIEGHITVSVFGHLGLAHLGSNVTIPAILFTPDPATSTTFTEFVCGTGVLKTKIVVKGSVIGEITSNVNEPLTKMTIKAEPGGSTGVPKWTEFLLALGENKLMTAQLLTKIGTGEEEESNETSTDELTALPSGETVEVKT